MHLIKFGTTFRNRETDITLSFLIIKNYEKRMNSLWREDRDKFFVVVELRQNLLQTLLD